MSADSSALGQRGERLAAEFLRRAGYEILARNFRLGHREIDLIVQRDGLVAFVEVKTRSGLGYGHPLESITALKRREIERVARAWAAGHGPRALNYRFDAVAVMLVAGREPAIEHVPGAWKLGD